jgi:hypothetical protein
LYYLWTIFISKKKKRLLVNIKIFLKQHGNENRTAQKLKFKLQNLKINKNPPSQVCWWNVGENINID